MPPKKQDNSNNSNNSQNNSISREEEIGYHKGAINTLVNERNELVRMLQVVDSLIQAHVKRLEELGVKMRKE